MTDNLPVPVEVSRFTTPRVVATGRECWWRLGPNIRDPHTTAQGYGVLDVVRCRGCEDPNQCGHFTMKCAGGAEVPVSCLEHRIRWGFSIIAIDVLTDCPPMLPKPTPWQQMTQRGVADHPGDNMRNWRFDNPWG